MASRRYPFQGQFGIHETPLTTVISYGEFKAAEQIIEANSDPTFLNDGRYENIPLHMVLTNNHYTEHCRNLKLARLLVQKGASPNLRIPYGDMDGASPSPFEELVVYYEVLRAYVAGDFDGLCEELEMYFETEESKLEFLTNTVDLDNTKCLPNLENIHKLIEQTSELIDVFLSYGSDPSVLTTFGHKSLFHWVIEHEDVVLAKRFLDTCRVNLNLKDVHGSSPLMDAILRNKPENAMSLYETMCETAEEVEINSSDCCGETALFRAVFAGATELANRLCKDGAKLVTAVCLSQVPASTCLEASSDGLLMESLHDDPDPMTTPLLASLLADSPVRLRYSQVSTHDCIAKVFQPHKHLTDKIVLAAVSPLIDMGSFNNQTVAQEVKALLARTSFRDAIMITDINPTDMLTLMFGQVSAGLRQLCVRTIFDQCAVFSQGSGKVWLEAEPHVFCPFWLCGRALGEGDIKKLMDLLGLPLALKIFFDIEAAKYQICRVIMSRGSMECDQACSASEESVLDDEESVLGDDEEYSSPFSVMYSDSDSRLFFSSDISEESSEEIDLSSQEEEEEEEEEEKEEKEKENAGKGEDVASKKKPELKKIRYEQESSTSESENVMAVVETYCEDLAEGVAQERPAVCCDKYQRLTDESTTTTESPENLTASDSKSDSLC